MTYEDDSLDYTTIIYRSRRVMQTAVTHKCTVCAKPIPAGSQAVYTFHLCGEDQHRPQYGYQCSASLGNSWYCNLYKQGGDSD